MKTLFLISFLFFVNFSNGQNVDATRNVTLLKKLMKPSHKMKAEGTPYINKAFLPVKITSFKNKIFSARYNAYNGEMEVIPAKGETPIVLNKGNVVYEVKFITLNKTYKAYTYFDKTEKIDFLVNVVILEYISLLKKEQVKYIPASKAKSSYQNDSPAQFKRLDDVFFIKIKNNDIIYLPKKKKNIANLFPNHSKDILNYIKSFKIKLSLEKDLIKLTKYINELN